MAFKNFKTYGRYKNRVIKTDLWISPERKRLFSSSDSSSCPSIKTMNSRENESHSFNLDSSQSSWEILPEGTDLSHSMSTPLTTCNPAHLSVNASKARLSLFSSISNNVALEHLPVHSTPMLGKQCDSTATGIPQDDVIKISPLCQMHQCNNSHEDQSAGSFELLASPILFSDSSSVCNKTSKVLLNEYESKLEPKSESDDSMVNLNIVDLTKSQYTLQMTDDLELTGQAGESSTPSVDVKTISNQMNKLCLLSAEVHLERLTSDQLNKENVEDGQRTVDYSFVEALTPQCFEKEEKLADFKEKILVQCEQQSPFKFTDVFKQCLLDKCVKVGEGTYGEVFKTNNGNEDVALKVIPVQGNFPVNNEPQKSFEEMIPEIVISKELSNLNNHHDDQLHGCPNFIKMRRVMLVQDSYPQRLLYEWDQWKKNHKCENDRPDKFAADQYFIIYEFNDGGEDLERFEFGHMEEALSVLQQIVLSLSVSELSLKFEHRDLHWGNILIKRSNCQTLHYKLNGDDIYIESCGVFVSIIDFTLSRLTKDDITVFCNLSKDPEIFNGKGDYQFDIYRLMRKANQDDWEAFVPYTNVLWIRYLIDKILNVKQYEMKNSSIQRSMRTLLRRMLSYHSALDMTLSLDCMFPTFKIKYFMHE